VQHPPASRRACATGYARLSLFGGTVGQNKDFGARNGISIKLEI